KNLPPPLKIPSSPPSCRHRQPPLRHRAPPGLPIHSPGTPPPPIRPPPPHQHLPPVALHCRLLLALLPALRRRFHPQLRHPLLPRLPHELYFTGPSIGNVSTFSTCSNYPSVYAAAFVKFPGPTDIRFVDDFIPNFDIRYSRGFRTSCTSLVLPSQDFGM
ncbi:hypothetical protein LINPERPRIM_LOCUS40922, partial [Linum perenne]